ncbi:uncharacterized protein LOC106177942 isoform X1 [Lingula anatina]|uniref:Uncharacterized protein LOC106177942 isoform X1 n=1 Tax=Lingula anatina TaxID=7574 RepID=A0A1S3K133_LINAN|nr:uncharacterized protein LOC106177942 isoform X1 [Lingula anatina]XP_013416344.1 uncharacterized protein LOC106177942 isoform X1 [Lingula anatina]XP_013416346.1 uncharacterized protein LOC106177942 isoform X1 [Lingula anatina]|eukprot:XP_013416343.1 uncharacterized protein LOC106177942 isoform X1 [Lingula anatina]
MPGTTVNETNPRYSEKNSSGNAKGAVKSTAAIASGSQQIKSGIGNDTPNEDFTQQDARQTRSRGHKTSFQSHNKIDSSKDRTIEARVTRRGSRENVLDKVSVENSGESGKKVQTGMSNAEKDAPLQKQIHKKTFSKEEVGEQVEGALGKNKKALDEDALFSISKEEAQQLEANFEDIVQRLKETSNSSSQKIPPADKGNTSRPRQQSKVRVYSSPKEALKILRGPREPIVQLPSVADLSKSETFFNVKLLTGSPSKSVTRKPNSQVTTENKDGSQQGSKVKSDPKLDFSAKVSKVFASYKQLENMTREDSEKRKASLRTNPAKLAEVEVAQKDVSTKMANKKPSNAEQESNRNSLNIDSAVKLSPKKHQNQPLAKVDGVAVKQPDLKPQTSPVNLDSPIKPISKQSDSLNSKDLRMSISPGPVEHIKGSSTNEISPKESEQQPNQADLTQKLPIDNAGTASGCQSSAEQLTPSSSPQEIQSAITFNSGPSGQQLLSSSENQVSLEKCPPDLSSTHTSAQKPSHAQSPLKQLPTSAQKSSPGCSPLKQLPNTNQKASPKSSPIKHPLLTKNVVIPLKPIDADAVKYGVRRNLNFDGKGERTGKVSKAVSPKVRVSERDNEGSSSKRKQSSEESNKEATLDEETPGTAAQHRYDPLSDLIAKMQSRVKEIRHTSEGNNEEDDDDEMGNTVEKDENESEKVHVQELEEDAEEKSSGETSDEEQGSEESSDESSTSSSSEDDESISHIKPALFPVVIKEEPVDVNKDVVIEHEHACSPKSGMNIPIKEEAASPTEDKLSQEPEGNDQGIMEFEVPGMLPNLRVETEDDLIILDLLYEMVDHVCEEVGEFADLSLLLGSKDLSTTDQNCDASENGGEQVEQKVNEELLPEPVSESNPYSLFEKPVDPKKKASAFVSDELEKYLEQEGKEIRSSFAIEENGPSEAGVPHAKTVAEMAEDAAIIEEITPEFTTVDGIVFASFSSKQGLEAQMSLEKKRDFLRMLSTQNMLQNLKAMKVQEGYSTLLPKEAKMFGGQNFERYQRLLRQEYGKLKNRQTPKKSSDSSKIKNVPKKNVDPEVIQKNTGINVHLTKSGKLHWKSEQKLLRKISPKKIKQMGLALKRKRNRGIHFTHRKTKGDDFKKPEDPKKGTGIFKPGSSGGKKMGLVTLTRTMVLDAVSTLDTSHLSPEKYPLVSDTGACNKPGCRYGCVCHLCEPSTSVDYDHGDSQQVGLSRKTPCPKEYCRMGCICESLGGRHGSDKTHSGKKNCGKEECQIECHCESSDDPLWAPPQTKLRDRSQLKTLQQKPKQPEVYRDRRSSLIFYEAGSLQHPFLKKKKKSKKKAPSTNQKAQKPGSKPTPALLADPSASGAQSTFLLHTKSGAIKQQVVHTFSSKVMIQDEEEEDFEIDIDNEDSDAVMRDDFNSCARTTVYIPVSRRHVAGTEKSIQKVQSEGNAKEQERKKLKKSHKKDMKKTVEDKTSANTDSNKENSKMSAAEIPSMQKVLSQKMFEVGTYSSQMVLLEPKQSKEDGSKDGTTTLGSSDDKSSGSTTSVGDSSKDGATAGDNTVDQQMSRLLQIKSNCKWGMNRQNILNSIAKYVPPGHTVSPDPVSMLVGEYVVEIQPKGAKPTAIPYRLQSKLGKEMYPIRVKISKLLPNYKEVLKKEKTKFNLMLKQMAEKKEEPKDNVKPASATSVSRTNAPSTPPPTNRVAPPPSISGLSHFRIHTGGVMNKGISPSRSTKLSIGPIGGEESGEEEDIEVEKTDREMADEKAKKDKPRPMTASELLRIKKMQMSKPPQGVTALDKIKAQIGAGPTAAGDINLVKEPPTEKPILPAPVVVQGFGLPGVLPSISEIPKSQNNGEVSTSVAPEPVPVQLLSSEALRSQQAAAPIQLVSGQQGAAAVQLVSSQQGATPIQLVSSQQGATPIQLVSSQQGATPIQLVSSQQGATPIQLVSSQQGATPIQLVPSQQGVAPIHLVSSQQGTAPFNVVCPQGAAPVQLMAGQQGAAPVQLVSSQQGAAPVHLVSAQQLPQTTSVAPVLTGSKTALPTDLSTVGKESGNTSSSNASSTSLLGVTGASGTGNSSGSGIQVVPVPLLIKATVPQGPGKPPRIETTIVKIQVSVAPGQTVMSAMKQQGLPVMEEDSSIQPIPVSIQTKPQVTPGQQAAEGASAGSSDSSKPMQQPQPEAMSTNSSPNDTSCKTENPQEMAKHLDGMGALVAKILESAVSSAAASTSVGAAAHTMITTTVSAISGNTMQHVGASTSTIGATAKLNQATSTSTTSKSGMFSGQQSLLTSGQQAATVITQQPVVCTGQHLVVMNTSGQPSIVSKIPQPKGLTTPKKTSRSKVAKNSNAVTKLLIPVSGTAKVSPLLIPVNPQHLMPMMRVDSSTKETGKEVVHLVPLPPSEQQTRTAAPVLPLKVLQSMQGAIRLANGQYAIPLTYSSGNKKTSSSLLLPTASQSPLINKAPGLQGAIGASGQSVILLTPKVSTTTPIKSTTLTASKASTMSQKKPEHSLGVTTTTTMTSVTEANNPFAAVGNKHIIFSATVASDGNLSIAQGGNPKKIKAHTVNIPVGEPSREADTNTVNTVGTTMTPKEHVSSKATIPVEQDSAQNKNSTVQTDASKTATTESISSNKATVQPVTSLPQTVASTEPVSANAKNTTASKISPTGNSNTSIIGSILNKPTLNQVTSLPHTLTSLGQDLVGANSTIGNQLPSEVAIKTTVTGSSSSTHMAPMNQTSSLPQTTTHSIKDSTTTTTTTTTTSTPVDQCAMQFPNKNQKRSASDAEMEADKAPSKKTKLAGAEEGNAEFNEEILDFKFFDDTTGEVITVHQAQAEESSDEDGEVGAGDVAPVRIDDESEDAGKAENREVVKKDAVVDSNDAACTKDVGEVDKKGEGVNRDVRKEILKESETSEDESVVLMSKPVYKQSAHGPSGANKPQGQKEDLPTVPEPNVTTASSASITSNSPAVVQPASRASKRKSKQEVRVESPVPLPQIKKVSAVPATSPALSRSSSPGLSSDSEYDSEEIDIETYEETEATRLRMMVNHEAVVGPGAAVSVKRNKRKSPIQAKQLTHQVEFTEELVMIEGVKAPSYIRLDKKIHMTRERARRTELMYKFKDLKQIVFPDELDEKISKINVLNGAIQLIDQLVRKDAELQNQIRLHTKQQEFLKNKLFKIKDAKRRQELGITEGFTIVEDKSAIMEKVPTGARFSVESNTKQPDLGPENPEMAPKTIIIKQEPRSDFDTPEFEIVSHSEN